MNTVVDIGTLYLSEVRLSYFYGFEPFLGKPSPQIPNPKPVYKASLIMGPDHPDLKKAAATIDAVGSAHQWKGGLTWAQVKAQLKAQDKICLHKGDVSAPGDPAVAGMFYLSATNSKPFTIVDGDRTPLKASDGRPYSGSIANAFAKIWAQDNTFGRRINATLTGIQHVRHAPSFGGGPPPASPEEFGIIAAFADEAAPSGVEAFDDLLG